MADIKPGVPDQDGDRTMTETDTGPDPLAPAQRISILHGHLEREKSRRRDAEAELARLREGARTLGKVVVGQGRAMEAARIELAQGSAEKAMQWILNSLPDVWDDPETEWDGEESAQAWFDRTESFYRADGVTDER